MEFSKPPPPSPLLQRDNSESLLENELAALCRGFSTVSLPHGNICCLASIFKRSEACSGCSERRYTPVQSPTDFPPLKNRSVWQSAHMPLALWARGLSSARSRSCSFSKTSPVRLDAASSRLSGVWSNQKWFVSESTLQESFVASGSCLNLKNDVGEWSEAWCTVQLGWEANHYVNLLGSHAWASILTVCIPTLTVGWMGSHNETTLYLNDYLSQKKTKSIGFCNTEKHGMAP